MEERIRELEKRVANLEALITQFYPVTVMLRLEDGLVHPVILFAKTGAGIPAKKPGPHVAESAFKVVPKN